MSSAIPAVSRRGLTRPACWAILVGCTLLLAPVQKSIDRIWGGYGQVPDVLYIPSGRVLRALCLGHEGLLADIYWTRVVQYFGRRRLEQSQRFDLLGPLLQITTELDPHLIIAYRFGSIFLAEKPPAGAGHPEQALHLLRRGIAANPDYWRLWEDLGFIYYWDLKDYANAARAFAVGSERPGAMAWMKALAATVAAKGGESQTSQLLWSEIYRSAENESMRTSAEEHLTALEAQEQLARLNSLLAQYVQKTGHTARSFQELLASGWLSRLPRDLYGVPYVIGADGRATLGPQSKVDMRLVQ